MQESHQRFRLIATGDITISGDGYKIRHIIDGFKASEAEIIPHDQRLELISGSSVLSLLDEVYEQIPEPARRSPVQVGITTTLESVYEMRSVRQISEPADNLTVVVVVPNSELGYDYVVGNSYVFDAATDYTAKFLGSDSANHYFLLEIESFAAAVSKIMEYVVRDTLGANIIDNTTEVAVPEAQVDYDYVVGETYTFVKTAGGVFTADFVEVTGGNYVFNNIVGTVAVAVDQIEERFDRDTVADDLTDGYGGELADLGVDDYINTDNAGVSYTFTKTATGTFVGRLQGAFDNVAVFTKVSGTVDLDVASITRPGAFQIGGGVTNIEVILIV